MGAALSNAIKSIDGSDDAEKTTRDALNALFELGKSRNDAAFAHATSDAMKVYAPIQKILLQRQSIVASATNNTDGIVNGIKGAVGNLMKGQILDGVTDLIGNALNVVLGSSSGQISQSYTYALVATDLGALLRIDVDVYSFEIKSQGLQSHAKNMTSITSIVSTVNPNGLTISDIRGVVSMSYGSSPIELQQKIFELVKSAWENDRKVAVGQSLTSADHQAFTSLLVPSKYEESMKARRVLGLQSPYDEPSPRAKVGKAALTAAVAKGQSVTNGTNGGVSLAALTIDQPQMVDIFIIFHVIDAYDDSWLNHMAGALRGFEIDAGFKYVGLSGGLSGSAASFQCQVSAESDAFDKAIAYCEETVIPSIRQAAYLSSIIGRISLQYHHPGGDSSGMASKILFQNNVVTNSSNEIITFFAAGKVDPLLVLQPKESGALDGTVSLVESLKPAPNVNPAKPGEGGGADTGGAPNGTDTTKPVKASTPKKWVTYQVMAPHQILQGMPAEIVKASPGYQVLINGPQDQMLSVKYTSEWPGSADGS